jgi:PAS domain S-box-containing protein
MRLDPPGTAGTGDMTGRGTKRKSGVFVFGISVLISFVFFVLDIFKPINLAVWLFYLIPLLFTTYAATRGKSYLLLVICTLLILLERVLAPARPGSDTEILNRAVGIIVLWLTIVILLERKRAEDNLRASNERYRDLVELSPETIYIQQEGRIAFVNSAGIRMLGANGEKDILGKAISDFLPPGWRNSEAATIHREQLGGREVSPVEHAFVRLDGTTVEAEVSAVPIEYLGKPAIQVFVRDITGKKRLEDQLRQSQKMEAVGRLAGGIAHDFNNLMTVITGYAETTMKRIGEPEKVKRALEEIGNAGLRATRLTRQLIAFSRKQILQPQILDLNRIVTNMNRMLRRLIGENIELITVPGEGLGKVKADPGQIEQVIVNLALNARDAMPKGGKLLVETMNAVLTESEIREHSDIPPGPYVKIVFRDNGVGMDPEIVSHIFEPYFTTKDVGKGSGLGLATVYGIIRQSGGDIRVRSEPGKGTTFTIWLPRTEEVSSAREPYELVVDAPHGRETILVVEDEDPVRRMVRETLEDAGYTVLEASGGEEALELLSRNHDDIHLLLSDVVMPKIGGRALAARAASLYPEVKVMFMTGYVDADTGLRDNPFGWKPSIFKPFTPGELARKVRDVLDG